MHSNLEESVYSLVTEGCHESPKQIFFFDENIFVKVIHFRCVRIPYVSQNSCSHVKLSYIYVNTGAKDVSLFYMYSYKEAQSGGINGKIETQ